MNVFFDEYMLLVGAGFFALLVIAFFMSYIVINAKRDLYPHERRELKRYSARRDLAEYERERQRDLLNQLKSYRRHARAWTIVIFIGGYVIINLFTFFAVDRANNVNVDATPALAAEYAYGMEHGGTYPLVIGNAVAGTTTEASVRSGLFTHSVDMRSSLDTGFTVDYVHDGSHFPLTIPSSKAEYITTGVRPGNERITMELEINHTSGTGNVSSNLGTLTYPCEPAFVNLLLRCVKTDEPPVYSGGAPTLAEVLSGDGIWHVTVYLTPDNYNTLFGFNS